MTRLNDKLIAALDVATAEEALKVVNQLRLHISRFKVGLQLYTAAGPGVVKDIVRSGANVFLDLKLHDIPNTVAAAVNSASGLGAEMLTIHLSGGEAMISAAVEAAGAKLSIVGVTVLTSHTDDSLRDLGLSEGVKQQVVRLAKLGVGCGVRALVASPREAAILRREFDSTVKIITPGIRPSGAATGDQKRVTTPAEAIKAGADYLVIGRPILGSVDPCAAVKQILTEMEQS